MEDTAYCCDGFIRTFAPPLEPSSIGYWVRADAVNSTPFGYIAFASQEDSNGALAYSFFYGGLLYLTGGDADAPSLPYASGEWHHVELRNLDLDNHTFDFYADGGLIRAGMQMATPASSLARIDLFTSRGSGDIVSYYDEIEIR